MKYKHIICLSILLMLIPFIALSEPICFSLERKVNSELPFSDIEKKLSCYPTLISHWNNEKGFSDKIEIKYGDLELIRTDVGRSDGVLTVSLKSREACKIELSLMPNIYYNSKDRLLLIYGYSGSSGFIELFSFVNGCKYIGWSRLNSKSDFEEIENNWFDQPDRNKICHQ